MTTVVVEGVTWGLEAVLTTGKTEEAFVVGHMADSGTYSRLPAKRKEAALRLVWEQAKALLPAEPKARAGRKPRATIRTAPNAPTGSEGDE